MKTSHVFDRESGTFREEKVPEPQSQTPVPETKKEYAEVNNTVQKPPEVVRMKRVDHPSSLCLIDDSGVPETYLDSADKGILMFREREDFSVTQIVDERTGKAFAYFGGYGLTIKFNMAELNSVEKIEQCLQGITKLFRKIIMDQALNGGTS